MTAAMDAIVAQAGARLAALERIQHDLNALSVTSRTDGGRIVVRVDATGGLAEVRLLPGAGNGDAAHLARLIVEAAAAGARELRARQAELTGDFLAEFGDTPEPEGTGGRSAASNYHAPAGRAGGTVPIEGER